MQKWLPTKQKQDVTFSKMYEISKKLTKNKVMLAIFVSKWCICCLDKEERNSSDILIRGNGWFYTKIF
jgi:hypothetical protein